MNSSTTKTKLLKGFPVSKAIQSQLIIEINKLKNKQITPYLVVFLIGEDPASEVYVNNKIKFFHKMSCSGNIIRLKDDISENELMNQIKSFNEKKSCHGILVQLPLPKHINEDKIIDYISPLKDVDGFHPENLGYLFRGTPRFIPCTPLGIIKIIEFYKIPVNNSHVVIVGRSNIVGKPLVALMGQKFDIGNATVTMCHTGTKDLSYHTKQADVLFVAIGIPKFLNKDMIKEGVDIIDIGINRIRSKKTSSGYKIVGDVDADSVDGKANSLTPVPGGVGPMTITMLLHNTIIATKINSI